MAVLPMVDLLICVSWTTLAAGTLLKVGNVVFAKAWALLGFAPMDLLAISVSMLIFAIALTGRQWLKANENAAPAARRANSTLDAYDEVRREEVEQRDAPQGAPLQQGWEARPLER